MRKKLSIASIILIAMLSVVSGCRKEGCTDIKASNFDPDGQISDNSCQYGLGPIGNDYLYVVFKKSISSASTVDVYYSSGGYAGSAYFSPYNYSACSNYSSNNKVYLASGYYVLYIYDNFGSLISTSTDYLSSSSGCLIYTY